MHTFTKKLTALLLLASMLLSTALIGCAESTDGKEEETTPSVVDAAVEETEDLGDENAAIDALEPDFGEVNMDGMTFTILSNNWGAADAFSMREEIYVEETTGEAINDAIFDRNAYVMSTYNCNIAHVNNNDNGTTNNMATKSVQSGDGAYDIYYPRMQSYLSLAQTKTIMQLTDIPELDLSASYFDQNSLSELSVLGMIFAVDTDITICDKDATSAMVFNKQLIQDFGFENPYDLVKNYEWTLEKMDTMLEAVSYDLDGDGALGEADRYGLYYQRDTLLAFLCSAGYALALKDADDVPYLTFQDENVITFLTEMAEILYNPVKSWNTMYWESHGSEDFNLPQDRNFSNDMALFLWVRMDNVHNLREMESDFGILPCPMWKSEQKEYRTWVNAWTSVTTTVLNIGDQDKLNNIGKFLQGWAWASTKYVKPAYYDQVLNGKISRDEDSKEMLDIIYGNRVYDMGANAKFGNAQEFIYMSMTNNASFATVFTQYQKRAEKQLATFLEKFEEVKAGN